jgi:hypothetical protein
MYCEQEFGSLVLLDKRKFAESYENTLAGIVTYHGARYAGEMGKKRR